MTVSLVSLGAIQQAAERVRGVARATPLIPSSSSDEWSHLWIKCENLQVIGAFKVRGAYNFLAALDPAVRARGVVTYSSGNHGQAVAYAARRFGTSAVIVMPTTAPAVKIDATRALGAEVHFAGTVSLERKAAAEAIQRERGLTRVPPFDDPDIIAGQGTVGLEIVDQQPAVTAVYVPMGGGGLISGIVAAIKGLRPNVQVVGIEPVGAPKMSTSLQAGHPVTLDHVNSMADGLLAVRPGELNFEHVRSLVDRTMQVSEQEIADAVRFLATHTKLLAEPSGAVSVAGACRLAPPRSSGVHVAVVSGGNAETEKLVELLAERPSSRQQ
jgi:threonine dehydratase